MSVLLSGGTFPSEEEPMKLYSALIVAVVLFGGLMVDKCTYVAPKAVAAEVR